MSFLTSLWVMNVFVFRSIDLVFRSHSILFMLKFSTAYILFSDDLSAVYINERPAKKMGLRRLQSTPIYHFSSLIVKNLSLFVPPPQTRLINNNITSFYLALNIYSAPSSITYPCPCDLTHNLPDTYGTAQLQRKNANEVKGDGGYNEMT